MMDTVVTVISGIFLLLGSFLILSGGVGVIRFPDFYTRMHAAGLTETLATAFIVAGLMLLTTELLVLAKLLMILAFIWFTGPTASHALAKSAQHSDLAPMLSAPDRQQSR